MFQSSVHLLIIDDNPGDVLLVREYLSDAPQEFHLYTAGTLAEGLEMARKSPVHIILLDLSLPDSHGMESFDKLSHEVHGIPIIILTGISDQQIALQAVRRGAQDYLMKDDLSSGLLSRSIRYSLERFMADEKRRWLETKMLYSQKLESLSVLSGSVAQNFNSLLKAIIGNADVAMKKVKPEDSVFRNLEIIKNSATEASDLSRQMLVYSDMGRIGINKINISQLIDELKPLISSTVNGYANLSYRLAEDLPSLKADVSQLKQMILNIVTNAAEAMGNKKGNILISTYLENQNAAAKDYKLPLFSEKHLVLSIEDNGVGINKEALSKITEPFYTTKYSGRGLGMAAAKGVATGHGGDIRIVSEEGVGTTVHVILPVTEV